MNFKPQNLVYVYYQGTAQKTLMGRLLLKNRQIFFEYDSHFIQMGFELSPFMLPLKAGVMASSDRTFEGLWGVFNDCLPDGWGRLLLDRKLIQLGFHPGVLSPLDRLCCVGDGGMGALSYEPENPDHIECMLTDLDEIHQEIQSTLEDNDVYIDNLLALNGSSAGARPKVVLRIGEEDWLIKFRSSFDPPDIGCIEYAYHLMAQAAGLDVPQAKIFRSQKGPGFFGVKRFDTLADQKIHMHTMSGLLHVDHTVPSLDYAQIMKATLYLTRDLLACEKQLRQAVFNVLSHNRDDHAKNFSFLMDGTGRWEVSPAYDLTFSSGPSGEHASMLMGEGQNPVKSHLLKLADVVGIQKQRIYEIIEQVRDATQNWDVFARKADVSNRQSKHIANMLNNIQHNFEKNV